jgi:serine/threonine-protein kinase
MTSILLNNRYQVIQVLGAGGFGETFLAEDTYMPSRRRCVIKQLKPISNDPQTYQMIQQRFEREAATLEYLGEHSSQIPRLYAYFLENGQFYLVQEWIQGQTLRDLLETKGQQSESIVRQIVLSLLSVLDYVHSKGIIHRDIKPDNIILRAVDQKPVLIDFGAVKETIRSVVGSPGNPTRSMVIGTPGYMPSEQAVGRPVYGTDIYSLGLTAIYLLTGKHPEELPTHPQSGEILWQQYASHISPDLSRVLTQAIKPQASDRFTTANKMLYALSGSDSMPVQSVVHPPQATQQTQAIPIPPKISPTKKQQPVWIFGVLIIAGLLGGVALSYLTRQSASEPILSDAIPSPTAIASDPPISAPFSPAPFIPTPTAPPQASPSPTPTNNPPINSDPPPIPVITPTPQATVTQPPTTENETVVTPPPEESAPENPPPSKEKSNTTRTVPAFPTGTPRSTVEATLGKPYRDLRGAWGKTRAVVYKLVPNQVDLGYLFDRDTGVLKQTEVAFAQSVDPQLMQTTLNGMLNGQATPKIEQGLQKVQQRQLEDFSFAVGSVKGQIIRQNCDLIYISVWVADLHDFVDPASARRC